jgi:hypothetical protein
MMLQGSLSGFAEGRLHVANIELTMSDYSNAATVANAQTM